GRVVDISASGERLVGQHNIIVSPGCCLPQDYIGYYGTPNGVTFEFHNTHAAVECAGISADGLTAIGTGPGAWRWSLQSGYSALPALLGAAYPNAVNADGSVVVGVTSPFGPTVRHAIKWH